MSDVVELDSKRAAVNDKRDGAEGEEVNDAPSPPLVVVGEALASEIERSCGGSSCSVTRRWWRRRSGCCTAGRSRRPPPLLISRF